MSSRVVRSCWVSALLRLSLFAAVAPLVGCATVNYGAFERVLSGESRLVELSHPMRAGMPVMPGGEGFESVEVMSIGQEGLYVNRISMDENTGTNLEAPARVIANTPSVDQLPARQFLGHGVVLDVREAVAEQPGYQVSRSDIDIWESDHSTIPQESIVLIWTGWGERWESPERYLNRDAQGKAVYPGISAEAVEFLIRERRVHGLGIDTMSLYAGSGDEPGQRDFLMTGKFYLNNLANLDKLPARGAVILAIPLRIEGGSGSPARVLAIIPQEKTAVVPGKKRVDEGTDAGFDQSSPRMGY